MPRQNRVTPFGEIVAFPERGTVMGNRGRLHDGEGRIRRPWQVTRWILCRLEFRGRHRRIMAPDRYTELFFLDEATGLAAGHRPCFECRRRSFHAFADAWAIVHPGDPPSAASIDARLHAERVGPDRSKRTFPANLDDLPDGAFVLLDGREDDPFLIRGDEILAWSPRDYGERRHRPRGERVSVLTPRSTVNVLLAGFLPEVHPSASGPSRGPRDQLP